MNAFKYICNVYYSIYQLLCHMDNMYQPYILKKNAFYACCAALDCLGKGDNKFRLLGRCHNLFTLTV